MAQFFLSYHQQTQQFNSFRELNAFNEVNREEQNNVETYRRRMYQKHTYKRSVPTVSKRRHSQNKIWMCCVMVVCVVFVQIYIAYIKCCNLFVLCDVMCIFENWMARFGTIAVAILPFDSFMRQTRKIALHFGAVQICNGVCHRLTHLTRWPGMSSAQIPFPSNDLEWFRMLVHAANAQKAQWNGTIQMHRPKLMLKIWKRSGGDRQHKWKV